MNNSEVVTIALYLLNGASIFCEIEDVAIQAFEIAPERFSWRKYKDRIDLRAIQDALKGAKNDYYLVTGSIKKGYILTKKGVDFCERIQDSNLSKHIQFRKNSMEEKFASEKLKMKTSIAYTKYYEKKYNNISLIDFYKFCKINEYFDADSREKKYNQIENIIYDDKDLVKLWTYLKRKFVEGKR